jgi:hypothetical protein
MGSLFKTTAVGGIEDLTFEYVFPGDMEFRQGVVVYQSLSPSLQGDYNGNGIVDAADYVVWRKGLGTTYTQNDYNIWRTHFGQTAAAGSGNTAAAVPEPASLILMIMAAAGVYPRCRRNT